MSCSVEPHTSREEGHMVVPWVLVRLRVAAIQTFLGKAITLPGHLPFYPSFFLEFERETRTG